MATVHVVLCRVAPRHWNLPIPDSSPLGADTLTSSGISTQSSLTAPDGHAVWSVTVFGGNVFIAFGADPTAQVDSGWLVLDGQTRDFTIGAAGEKIAIKDA